MAKNFTDTVKEKALGQNVLTAVKPSQLMVKIVHDELTQLMGGETAEINIDSRPAVILMSGLQGSGKTTFSGKLARMLKSKKNRKPLLVACDVYRPAAIEQLRVLAEQKHTQDPLDMEEALSTSEAFLIKYKGFWRELCRQLWTGTVGNGYSVGTLLQYT